MNYVGNFHVWRNFQRFSKWKRWKQNTTRLWKTGLTGCFLFVFCKSWEFLEAGHDSLRLTCLGPGFKNRLREPWCLTKYMVMCIYIYIFFKSKSMYIYIYYIYLDIHIQYMFIHTVYQEILDISWFYPIRYPGCQLKNLQVGCSFMQGSRMAQVGGRDDFTHRNSMNYSGSSDRW